jgi:hypothetical protein
MADLVQCGNELIVGLSVDGCMTDNQTSIGVRNRVWVTELAEKAPRHVGRVEVKCSFIS